MKHQHHYFKATVKQISTRLEFESLAEMCRYVDTNQISNIFIINDAESNETHFALQQNTALLTHNTLGFNNLENYITAQEKGFPDATTFYDAQQNGYSKYSDYKLVKEAGIADLATFETMKNKGFVNGYTTYKELLEKDPTLFYIEDNINNPYELFCYAKKHHFEDFTKLHEALSKGFTDADLYNAAKELGYPTYKDFLEGKEKKLRTFAELVLAREKNIRDSDDFTRYIDLEVLRKNGETHDQLLLLIILSKIEQGKKVSLNKINTILQAAIKEYYYTDNNELPLWFTIALNSSSDIATFLQKSIQVKKYGEYDVDGEFFEINRMQDRAVVLDASNIAHNSNVNIDKKVLAGNIIILIDFLKQKGFEDITVIADASLRHKVADADMYEKLNNENTLLIAPKETSADLFIISYVKKHHCLLVSNDTFRDWKMQDPWIADNIDFYRLSFLIKGNEVLMPDLK